MAEFLQILAEQYDYPQLVDEILKFVFPGNVIVSTVIDRLIPQGAEQQGVQQQ